MIKNCSRKNPVVGDRPTVVRRAGRSIRSPAPHGQVFRLSIVCLLFLSLLFSGMVMSAEAADRTEAIPAAQIEWDPVGEAGLPADVASVPCGATAASGNPREVLVGGMPFGVKFYTDGVLVVGFCDVTGADGKLCNPARNAGIHPRDVITHLGGKPLTGAAELTTAVENSGGRAITLTVHRPDGGNVTVQVTPILSGSENRYKTGIWIRDSGAGIGTVTFMIPGTQAFAGLGHGICDGDTGDLIPMQRGQVTDVTVSGIDRGVPGEPGAIKGYFTPGKTGTLVGNTACGVFGILSALPGARTTVPVGTRNDLHEGQASLRCTLDDGKIGEYTVRISAIDRNADGSKCFTVTVTDPALLQKTGGIVQGMSGSPILQDGKLIGAVTHVLINDPTTGYGIFVDNMLRDMPELLK